MRRNTTATSSSSYGSSTATAAVPAAAATRPQQQATVHSHRTKPPTTRSQTSGAQGANRRPPQLGPTAAMGGRTTKVKSKAALDSGMVRRASKASIEGTNATFPHGNGCRPLRIKTKGAPADSYTTKRTSQTSHSSSWLYRSTRSTNTQRSSHAGSGKGQAPSEVATMVTGGQTQTMVVTVTPPTLVRQGTIVIKSRKSHEDDGDYHGSELDDDYHQEADNKRMRVNSHCSSQSKLSGDEVTPTRDDKEPQQSASPNTQHKGSISCTSDPSGDVLSPPREERSAPEGTSSPTPHASDRSEDKPSTSQKQALPDGYLSNTQVQELLKQQELQFEQKLLLAEVKASENEKKLREQMKSDQRNSSSFNDNMAELSQSRDALLKMVGQYKDMLAQLVSEKEKERQEQDEKIKQVEMERDQAIDDLSNVENAFSDVHRKYERTKQVVDTLRRNEETLRGAVEDYEAKIQRQEEKFLEFQKHAEEKIQQANEEFEGMRRGNEQEMTKMAALLKKAEMKIVSLQDALDRKSRENQELTQLCDDLISKVGSGS